MCAEYSPIPELNLLKEFDDVDPSAGFSEGFEFHQEYGTDDGPLYWFDLQRSQVPRVAGYLEQLVPFAQATGSGSFYALWKCDDRADLATLPVVFFGDEGGLLIVGRGLRDLFRLLAVDDENFERDPEEYEESNRHQEYCAWLETHFGLTAPEDADPIIEAAMTEYAEPFADWLEQFLTKDDVEAIRKNLKEATETFRDDF